MKKILLIASLILIPYIAFAQSNLLAFPTAEGYGKYAKGGRGGQVVFVTNLDDYVAYNNIESEIPGSLRWALKQYSGQPLTVIFRVSGTIKLKPYFTLSGTSVYNQNDLKCQRANVTIAGQTAPGEGICIRNTKVNFGGSTDLIIRNVRFRIGEAADPVPVIGYKVNGVARDSSAAAGSFIPGGSLGCENALRVILDHCVFGWSGEENITMYDNRYTTVQWSIMHEGLYDDGHGKGNRSYGGQCGGMSSTWHHNLYAHNYSRSPRLNGARTDNETKVFIEFINNVNYNWGRSGAPYGGEIFAGKTRSHTANFKNNYFKPGPGTDANRIFFSVGTLIATANAPKWHVSGNIMEGNAASTSDNWKAFSVDYSTTGKTQDSIKSDTLLIPPLANVYSGKWIEYAPYKINIQTAEEAYNAVIQKVGTINRDSVERRIIREVKTGTSIFKASQGKWGIIDKSSNAEGYLQYPVVTVPVDNDNDGMADDWEVSNGLDPANTLDRNVTTLAGYTALEVYLAELMGERIEHNFFSGVNNLNSYLIQLISLPEHGSFKIISDEPVNNVSIFDITGKIVYNQSLSEIKEVIITNLKSGSYIVNTKSSTGRTNHSKIILK